jgi:tRNA-specific 2-thiouridylase
MSGGVDSAVALAEAPGEAFGVTLRLWIDPLAPDADRACCAPGSVRRARDLCHARGLPHFSLDLREAFRTTIVEPFVAGYGAGETPNPCTACNGAFRLHELVAAAARLGATRVRTGHYARIVEVDGVPLVARGEDRSKDQSYMLARVPPEVLARLEFPLGDRTKADVRARAAALGLAAAGVRESQEVCFLGGGDYRSFLARHGSGAAAGAIEDESGEELGRHAGVAGFTPGQRRGIGVSAPEPLYVLRTERERSAVVVAPLRRLGTRRVALRDVVMHRERRHVDAKLRYRSPAVGATLLGAGDDRTLALERELFAVAPGQTAALYEGDAVVGCGTIARAVSDVGPLH